jgi:hypothetical protein
MSSSSPGRHSVHAARDGSFVLAAHSPDAQTVQVRSSVAECSALDALSPPPWRRECRVSVSRRADRAATGPGPTTQETPAGPPFAPAEGAARGLREAGGDEEAGS